MGCCVKRDVYARSRAINNVEINITSRRETAPSRDAVRRRGIRYDNHVDNCAVQKCNFLFIDALNMLHHLSFYML